MDDGDCLVGDGRGGAVTTREVRGDEGARGSGGRGDRGASADAEARQTQTRRPQRGSSSREVAGAAPPPRVVC